MTLEQQFAAKKQEIIMTIDILSGEDSDMAIQYAQQQIELLQPPRPTCATCDDCEHHEIDCGEGVLSDCYRCLSDKLDWNMLPYIEEPTNFGCIHHSSYEVVE